MTEPRVEHRRECDTTEIPAFEHKRATDAGLSGFLRRHLPVIGYVILAAAIAWSIASVRSEGIDRRHDLATSAKKVVLEGCERDNSTRDILRQLAAGGIVQAKRYEKEGLFTHEQAARSIAASKKAAAKLPPINCAAEAEKIDGP